MSSSLTGGQIAGICVGSVLGFLVAASIVGRLSLVCCGGRLFLWPRRGAREWLFRVTNGDPIQEAGPTTSVTCAPMYQHLPSAQQAHNASPSSPLPTSLSHQRGRCNRQPTAHIQQQRLIASHRGGSINGPENTLETFQFAVASGATVLELDVGLSADGFPIIFHDADVERIVDARWLQANPTVKLISDIVAGGPDGPLLPPVADVIPLHFPKQDLAAFDRSHSKDKNNTNDNNNENPVMDADRGSQQQQQQQLSRVCTLETLFKWCPQSIILHIDLKHRSKEEGALVASVVELVNRYRRPGTTILGSVFPHNSNQLYRAREQRMNLHGLIPTVADEHSIAGCASCCCCCCACCCCSYCCAGTATSSGGGSTISANLGTPIDGKQHMCGSSLRPPPPFLLFASLPQTALTLLLYYTGLLPYWRIPYDVYSCPFPSSVLVKLVGRPWVGSILRTPGLWEHLQRRGIAVFFWVLNAEEEFEETLQYAHDGVMTDDTVALRQFYEQREARRGINGNTRGGEAMV